MSTTAQSTALSPFEGAAMRVQLDAMLNVLVHADEEAAKLDDNPVRHLVASLHEARAAAQEIEDRGQTTPSYRGVTLVRL